ncbi:MAG: signal peptidase I [Bacillota bacterium]|nr:signal peptidase I [Bacillota bacterium]
MNAEEKTRDAKSIVREYVESTVMAVALALFIMTFIARSFSVDGSSMVPTLHNGERVLVDEISYRLIKPARGEIIVFRLPANPKVRYIKRIIGLPGDTVEIRDGRVLVNGEPLQEDYLSEPIYGDFGPYRVPEDSYFVLGDNRNNSEDSRFRRVGYVPRRYIVGRAIFRYWPLSKVGVLSPPEAFRERAASRLGEPAGAQAGGSR